MKSEYLPSVCLVYFFAGREQEYKLNSLSLIQISTQTVSVWEPLVCYGYKDCRTVLSIATVPANTCLCVSLTAPKKRSGSPLCRDKYTVKRGTKTSGMDLTSIFSERPVTKNQGRHKSPFFLYILLLNDVYYICPRERGTLCLVSKLLLLIFWVTEYFQ